MLSIEIANHLSQKGKPNFVKAIVAFDTWIVSRFMDSDAKRALNASIMQQYHLVEVNLKEEDIDPQAWMELYTSESMYPNSFVQGLSASR